MILITGNRGFHKTTAAFSDKDIVMKPLKNISSVSDKIIINWGRKVLPRLTNDNPIIINKPEYIYNASNKIHTFTLLKNSNLPIPWFTTSEIVAFFHLKRGYKLVARKKISSCGGRGIVLITSPDNMVYAPLYTEYIDKDIEFRVHVFKNEVIDIVCKVPTENTKSAVVWNHTKGYHFIHKINYPSNVVDVVKNVALEAIVSLSLDFGAVDVMCKGDKVYILEVNTAPGVSIPETVNAYAEALNKLKELETNDTNNNN